jgi:hypothetical protein
MGALFELLAAESSAWSQTVIGFFFLFISIPIPTETDALDGSF